MTASIGSLGVGATATVTIVMIPIETGTITDTAKVGADQVDPHPADNQVTVLVATTLDVPINVFSSLMQTSKGPYQVLVTWGYPNSAQNGISFNVYRVDASGSEIKISGPTGTSAHDFIDTSAEANKTYVYRVTAFVGNGEGARSDPTTIVVNLNSPSGPGASSHGRAAQSLQARLLDPIALPRNQASRREFTGTGRESQSNRSVQVRRRPPTYHKPPHLS